LVITAAITAALWRPWAERMATDPSFMRLDLDLAAIPPGDVNVGPTVIVSPDGRRILYVASLPGGIQRLHTRRLDEDQPRELIGTDGAYNPFLSPDGNWVGFFARGYLRKVSVHGGSPISICAAGLGRGASWAEDGSIVAALDPTTSLSRVSEEGGTPSPFTALADGEMTHRWPQFLPGREAVLFTANSKLTDFDNASIEVIRVRDKSRKTIHRGGTFGRYLRSGHLVWLSNGGLFAAPFSVERLELTGRPFLVLTDVQYSTINGSGQFYCSDGDMVIYRSGKIDAGSRLLSWLDPAGHTSTILSEPDDYFAPAIAPDGGSVAVVAQNKILLFDIARGASRRLTHTLGRNPVWTPDGEMIFFGSGRDVEWVRASSGDKPAALGLAAADTIVRPGSFSRDGSRLAYSVNRAGAGWDLFTVLIKREGGKVRHGNPEPFLTTPANEHAPAFSPDGRWIAYHSDESGNNEVYVRSFPDRGEKWQVSSGGGLYPKWSRVGNELLFRANAPRVMVVPYQIHEGLFIPGKQRYFSEKTVLGENFLSHNFDVAPDGKLVVLLPGDPQDSEKAPAPIHLLLNFSHEIRRRTRTQ
jgi:serine/threonine-protein kinase